MKQTDPYRSGRTVRLPLTLALAGIFLLCGFHIDVQPETPDSALPGELRLAKAEEATGSEAPSAEANKPANEVIVYVTAWCPACTMTTDYLTKKRVPFVVKDIEKNEQHMKEMIKKVGGYRGVPVVDINGRILLGFNPYIMDQLAK